MPQRSWTTRGHDHLAAGVGRLAGLAGTRTSTSIVKGFTYNGRLEIRGGGPFWMECDPTFQVVNRQVGSVSSASGSSQTNGATVTGYPGGARLRQPGPAGAQAAVDCYLEVDAARQRRQRRCCSNQIGGAGTKTGGTFKIKGGGYGRGAMPPGCPGYEAAF